MSLSTLQNSRSESSRSPSSLKLTGGGSSLTKSRKKAPSPNGFQDESNKVFRKLRGGRTHFSRSKVGGAFPVHLLRHRYKQDEWGSCLQPDPSHVAGANVEIVDLRYWFDLRNVVTLFHSSGIRIKEMILSGNSEADVLLLEHLLSLYGGKSSPIVSLTLANCGAIDRAALTALGHFSNLHTLDLSDNLFLKDAHCETLIEHELPALHTLNLSACPFLTNQTLFAISRRRLRIEAVTAGKNKNFTHEGAYAIVLHCENLKKLDLADCPGLDFVGVVFKAGEGAGGEPLYQHATR
jgi:hypothetical protein